LTFLTSLQVPYNVTQKDILNFLCKDFLGRDAKIVTPEYGPAVHVMMDRTSGKTLDVYVEFLSHRDAVVFTQKLAIAREKEHRKLMIGERHITWEISSQEALMRDLFPRAKNVVWEGQMPKIIADTTPYNTGFKCFITNEELLSMAKQAEQPNKVLPHPYSLGIDTNTPPPVRLHPQPHSPLREHDLNPLQGNLFPPSPPSPH
jgi:hypothetical protein